MVGVNDLALNLVGPSSVVPQAPGSSGNITLGHGDGLAVVEGLNSSEEVDVLLEEIGQLDQELATVLGSLLPPVTLESLSCRSNGKVDILLGSLLDGADDGLVGRVDDLEGLAIYGLDPLIVDEAAFAVSAFLV